MILTGSLIMQEVVAGRITISPFAEECVNPNSYNYRLGERLFIPRDHRADAETAHDEFVIPEDGVILEPGKMYLGHTFEILGSAVYAMSLIGRSSIGRVGLFLQVSANLGHTGSSHQWTLELVAVRPLRVYPRMRIGQISFWCNHGAADLYEGGYTVFNHPQPSLLEKTRRS